MNTTNTRRWRRIPIHLAAAAAVVAGGAAIGGAAIANDDDGPPVDARPAHADRPAVTEARPTGDQRERQRLQEALAAMPPYWPAAQAMRQELSELGGPIDRLARVDHSHDRPV